MTLEPYPFLSFFIFSISPGSFSAKDSLSVYKTSQLAHAVLSTLSLLVI